MNDSFEYTCSLYIILLGILIGMAYTMSPVTPVITEETFSYIRNFDDIGSTQETYISGRMTLGSGRISTNIEYVYKILVDSEGDGGFKEEYLPTIFTYVYVVESEDEERIEMLQEYEKRVFFGSKLLSTEYHIYISK